MRCRNCGKEIAEKALICYRCGISTTEAKCQPHVPARASFRPTFVVVVVAVASLALLAWFLLHS